MIQITNSNLTQTRKYIFLNDGKTMIATAQNNYVFTVFNITSPTDYIFQVNDTIVFFLFYQKLIFLFRNSFHFHM
jgi:hypothetical protein